MIHKMFQGEELDILSQNGLCGAFVSLLSLLGFEVLFICPDRSLLGNDIWSER